MDCTSDRHDTASSATTIGRQKTLLARLVSAVEPNSAALIADNLIDRFGSIGRVLGQSVDMLEREIGNRQIADILLLSQQFVHEAMREEISGTKFELGDPRFGRYLVSAMLGARDERLIAVFLDHCSRFICEETIGLGTWGEVSIRLRTLLRRAIELDAAQLVLCHNHPSGIARPSDRDIEFTDRLRKDSGSLGIELLDHIIVAGPTLFSMRNGGAMR
jgi:DNA repair protein RadC